MRGSTLADAANALGSHAAASSKGTDKREGFNMEQLQHAGERAR
jgi:hypothetical protein